MRLFHNKTVRSDTSGMSLRGTLVTKQSRLYVFLNNHLKITGLKLKVEKFRMVRG